MGSIPDANEDDERLKELVVRLTGESDKAEARLRESMGAKAYKEWQKELRRFQEGYPTPPLSAWMRKYGIKLIRFRAGGKFIAYGDSKELEDAVGEPGTPGRPPGTGYWTAELFHAQRRAAIKHCRLDHMVPTSETIGMNMERFMSAEWYEELLKRFPPEDGE